MAQASKEQLVIILDVGKSMSQSRSSSTSSLEGAIKAVNLLVQQKLLFGKKDEIGVVLFGTPETKNNLSENGYEHIVVLRDISIPDLELVRQIENINPVLDALIVAMDMLINAAQSIKKTTTVSKRIFLVTDAGNKINKDGLKIVVDQFMKMEAKLNIIGIDFEDDDSNKSDTKIDNEKLMKEIADKVGGVIVPVSEAIDMMSYFRSVSVVQKSTFRGMLEISSKIQIPIWSYLKTYEQKFPSMTKVSVVSQESAHPGTMQVVPERTYQSSTEPDNEVGATERVKGYRYGKTLVPFAQTDESLLKYTSNSCLKVIGFTSSKNVPRHHYLGNTECIVPDPRDKDCGVALSAIIHALAETDSVAIVRYCKRKGYSPHLGFLAPHIKTDYESPDKARKSVAPTSAQLDAAEKLINDMDLMHNEEREDGSFGESLKPKYTYNPVLQRFYQCVQFRALNPDSNLPKLDPLIEKYINPDEQLLQKCGTRIKQFKEEFHLIKSEKKQEKTDREYWRNNLTANAVKLDSYIPDQNKKRKMEGEFADFSLEEFISNGVSEVGSIKPVDDFRSMLARRDVDLVEKAIEGIKKRIIQLVNDSILSQLYPKAIECLLALRQACVQEEESDSFNKFLVDLRSYYEGKRRDDFWKLIVTQNITLIDSSETEDSSISPDEARQFLSARKDNDIVAKPAVEDTSAEDLFAMVE